MTRTPAALIHHDARSIAEAMSAHPARFLFLQVPLESLKEEALFRGAAFGSVFLAVAAIKPASEAAAKRLRGLPPTRVTRWLIESLESAGTLSRLAFPAAALASTAAFVLAHVPNWGSDPAQLLTQAALGLALAHIAYRSRSLTAAWTAHATYDMLDLGVSALGVRSMAFVLCHWLSWRKAKRVAKKR